MASSTSQSVLVEPFGMMTSSFGPTMQFGALLKRIGSFGISAPVSAAWSAKFRPTAMKLRTSPTQAPMRGEPEISGSDSGESALILAMEAEVSALPARSGMTPDRSRNPPFASRRPGFSWPGAP